MFRLLACASFLALLHLADSRPQIEGLQTYELLDYKPIEVDCPEKITKSDGKVVCKNMKSPVSIDFAAYKRSFPMRLKPSCRTDWTFVNLGNEETAGIVEGSGATTIVKNSREILLFQGHLNGESNSTIDGSMENGIFQGYVITGTQQKFFIERIPEEKRKEMNNAHSLIFETRGGSYTSGAVSSGVDSGSLCGEGSGEEAEEGSGQQQTLRAIPNAPSDSFAAPAEVKQEFAEGFKEENAEKQIQPTDTGDKELLAVCPIEKLRAAAEEVKELEKNTNNLGDGATTGNGSEKTSDVKENVEKKAETGNESGKLLKTSEEEKKPEGLIKTAEESKNSEAKPDDATATQEEKNIEKKPETLSKSAGETKNLEAKPNAATTKEKLQELPKTSEQEKKPEDLTKTADKTNNLEANPEAAKTTQEDKNIEKKPEDLNEPLRAPQIGISLFGGPQPYGSSVSSVSSVSTVNSGNPYYPGGGVQTTYVSRVGNGYPVGYAGGAYPYRAPAQLV